MTTSVHGITPCLWFDTEAEEAAKFYTSVFKNSKIGRVSRFGTEGSVITVEFEIDGRPFVALNGGPLYKFSEAVSFQVFCETQDEIDYFWTKLSEGGAESRCGWLKDRFGLSWQVIPKRLPQLLSGENAEKSQRVMKALLSMNKLDIAALEQARAV